MVECTYVVFNSLICLIGDNKMSNDNKMIILVYYRTLPTVLEHTVLNDGRMTIIKEGIRPNLGYSCPRATIIVNSKDDVSDENRINGLLLILDELFDNNQIVSYKITKSL